MIVLRALDYNCLSMRTAVTLTDKRALDETAASMEEMGEFGEIDTDQLRTISDHLFMVFHGSTTPPICGAKICRNACPRRSTPRASTSCCWYGP